MNEERKLPTKCETGKKKERLIICAAVLFFILMLGTAVFMTTEPNKPVFTPPEFDLAAVAGEPNSPEELGYNAIDVEQGFAVKLYGILKNQDGSIDVYLTNSQTNEVWVQAVLLDETGKEFGKTGTMKQGEYVKNISLTETLSK